MIEKFDSLIYCHLPSTEVNWSDMVGKLKPGSHIVAISLSLEHHRITAAMEDSGVEIRDSILFLSTPCYIITLGRVPLEGTVAQDVLRHGSLLEPERFDRKRAPRCLQPHGL